MRSRLILLALTFLALLAPVHAPAARADDAASAALSSFQTITNRYRTFFATTRFIVDKQMVPWAPTGAYFAWTFVAKSVTYDVEVTNSLVSPYLGHVDVVFRESVQGHPCGFYRTENLAGFAGFATAQEANASTARPECLQRNASLMYDDPVRFDFAYKGGKWVFQGATRANYAKPEIAITAAITARPMEASIPVSPIDAPVNAGWPSLAEP